MPTPAVDWQRVRGVVFDVDGTLYPRRAMQQRMARELALRCLARPATWNEARILRSFRRLREEMADEEASGIGRLQYQRTAELLGQPVERIEAVVAEWMFQRPLRHVAAARRPGARRLFEALRRGERRIGVWSDYPAAGKLEAMGLEADAVVTALDPEVDRLKPRPEGLFRTLELLGVPAEEALMIGDRDERDGKAARRAACPYLLLDDRAAGPRGLRSLTELLRSLPAGKPRQREEDSDDEHTGRGTRFDRDRGDGLRG